MMRLEYRTNNLHDTVLLVDADWRVRSTWEVTPTVLRDFCDCTQDAGDWDDGGRSDTPKDYGELVAVREGYALMAVEKEKWAERINFYLH